MERKIILCADSTCDLNPELKARYQVEYFPFHIILDGNEYLDNVDITAQEIFDAYKEKKLLPGTAPTMGQDAPSASSSDSCRYMKPPHSATVGMPAAMASRISTRRLSLAERRSACSSG